MTPAQVAHIMALLDQYVRACKGVTNYENVMAAKAVRDKLEAALRDAPQQAEPGMVSVTQKDANNYCLVLRALGMEDEGDPVAAIEDLKAAAEPAIQHVTVASLMQTRGYHALVQVIYELQQDGAYSDEEGEETNTLVELLHAIEGTPSAPTAVEHKPLFAEMIAQHPGLREEMMAGQGEPVAKDCLTTAAAVEPRVVDRAELKRLVSLVFGEDFQIVRKAAVEPDEPKSLNAKIADQLRPFLKPGDKVIWREAFRWHDDNGVMPNHYDGMSIAGLADEFGYRFDWDFNMNHAAIIQGAALNASKEQP